MKPKLHCSQRLGFGICCQYSGHSTACLPDGSYELATSCDRYDLLPDGSYEFRSHKL